ncbi:hypothetical protein MATL_G00174700 [Megalops atlanticus]|uniref:Ig-like domain-containing protein n=1 Tax=Megalops atlanticus TaxID=7932 RepID=A0A9D3PTP6_MEGAT|nr:hypothetical protein MATL_G00174700 [Megalops atlanticus]
MEGTWVPALLYWISLVPATLVSQPLLVTVKPGDAVTFLCLNAMQAPGHLAWFRQGPNESVPLCILSSYSTVGAKVFYHNGFQSNRVKLHLANNSCTLKMMTVDVSDSGLYFCGIIPDNHMIFHNATFLRVKGNEEPVEDPPAETPEKDVHHGNGSFLPAILALGGVVIIQMVVILVLICRAVQAGRNKQHTVKTSQQHSNDEQNGDPDMLNYAALNFTGNRKGRRRETELDTHVVYAATR